eukprot:jgi/Botrbrau1/19909/Bobra.0059s0026.1
MADFLGSCISCIPLAAGHEYPLCHSANRRCQLVVLWSHRGCQQLILSADIQERLVELKRSGRAFDSCCHQQNLPSCSREDHAVRAVKCLVSNMLPEQCTSWSHLAITKHCTVCLASEWCCQLCLAWCAPWSSYFEKNMLNASNIFVQGFGPTSIYVALHWFTTSPPSSYSHCSGLVDRALAGSFAIGALLMARFKLLTGSI